MTKIISEKDKEKKSKNIKKSMFKRKIKTTFINMGFIYLDSENKHTKIGNRDVEIDSIFLYENILLICEDTCAETKDTDHIRTKMEAFSQIEKYLSDFIDWLCRIFPDQKKLLSNYQPERYQVRYLYFPLNNINLTEDEKQRYNIIVFIQPQILNYFNKIAKTIKLSAKYELCNFLKIKREDVGILSEGEDKKVIRSTIIYPPDFTGLRNGVRVISFMMSPRSLLETCYVMRKDGWEDEGNVYQRLVDTKRIREIRKFLISKGEAFFNNIIVGLPDNVKFITDKGEVISIEEVKNYEECKLEIYKAWNSICVIDGQHRIFAHYEAPATDRTEKQISLLRDKLQLLVTGLIFPKNMSDADKIKIEREIFVDINDNTRIIPSDVLLHIKMIKDPLSPEGLARSVIKKLNNTSIFLDMFELSSVNGSKIKVASIIKFALRYLVDITLSKDNKENNKNLFDYWQGDKGKIHEKDQQAIEEYTGFCASKLSDYFSAIKKNFKNDWKDKNSKILSVTAINGFIIAYNYQLNYNAPGNFNFFDQRIGKIKVNFSKEEFPYASSQYNKFAKQIIKEAFPDLPIK